MKTNAKQIEAIANLVKPFDAIQQTYFLGVELIGFNTASDKIIDLQNQIESSKVEKGARKKAIDLMLKDMIKNNVKMITEGTGKTKCPIRLELKRVLDTSNLADGTKNNIVTAVGFALKHGKPYDIKGPDKYNAMLKAEKEKEKLKNEILKGGSELKNAIPPTTTAPTTTAPTTTAPTTTAPTTTAPTTTTPTKVNAPKVEPESATQYIKSLAVLMNSAFTISESRRMLGDEHEKTYDDIISAINDIMDLAGSIK
jgi:hypothetical protein